MKKRLDSNSWAYRQVAQAQNCHQQALAETQPRLIKQPSQSIWRWHRGQVVITLIAPKTTLLRALGALSTTSHRRNQLISEVWSHQKDQEAAWESLRVWKNCDLWIFTYPLLESQTCKGPRLLASLIKSSSHPTSNQILSQRKISAVSHTWGRWESLQLLATNR